MLYVIGLGLSDEKDITVKGLEAVKRSSRVYLEAYTSILMISKEKLEEFYGREIILATREVVELEADSILHNAQTEDVSFLVVGDPTAATTHTDLLLRAGTKGIECEVIHNASIMTALGSTGLQLYNFGQTLSLCFYTDSWKPGSWYDRLEENLRLGMHTCVLLDIKVREQSEEDMIRGIKRYGPPRYMTPSTAISQILYTENERHPPSLPPTETSGSTSNETSASTSSPTSSRASSPDPTQIHYPNYPTNLDPRKTLVMSLSRLGTPTQLILAGTLEDMSHLPESVFGGPLHSLVIVGGNGVGEGNGGKGRLHPLEAEYAGRFASKEFGLEEGYWRCVREDYGVVRETFD